VESTTTRMLSTLVRSLTSRSSPGAGLSSRESSMEAASGSGGNDGQSLIWLGSAEGFGVERACDP
jgi:hypothetical protein